MQIKLIRIKNFLGIDELEIAPGKINIIRGPKGVGKSTILEGIEKIFTNKDRRTETIKHGESEATLFLETDNGLEIDRRLRDEKADYFKLRKGDEGISSTEKYLKDFINGNIFRPIDWVNMKSEEQTKSILNMLQIDWSKENIKQWFGEIPSNVEFSQHILMVLKAIEVKYYKDREEVNRRIKELKTQIQVIKKDMPADYDGEVWREKKVQEYYKLVSDAEKVNGYIKEAEALQENIKSQIETIEANSESEKSRTQMKYKDQRQDIKDIVDLSNSKIEKAETELASTDDKLKNALIESESDYNKEFYNLSGSFEATKKKLEDEYNQKLKDVSVKFIADKDNLNQRKQESKDSLNALSESFKESEKDNIILQNNKISAKNQELISLDEIETQAIKAVEVKKNTEIEKVKLRAGKAAEFLKTTEQIEIEPLQKDADEVANMQSYLRQWDNMIDIRDNKLSVKEREAQELTARIDKARTLPSELLKTAQMPIDGISVDEKGLIRINNTLIDGLSSGEKLELAFKIAKAQAGDLKVICIDKFESLKSEEKQILENAMDDDFQYFITEHTATEELEIEKIG